MFDTLKSQINNWLKIPPNATESNSRKRSPPAQKKTGYRPARRTSYKSKVVAIRNGETGIHSGIGFRVIHGNGGIVVESWRYNANRDEKDYKIYVISDNEVLSEALAKIITMESLRN